MQSRVFFLRHSESDAFTIAGFLVVIGAPQSISIYTAQYVSL